MDRRTFIKSGLGAAGGLVLVSCTKNKPGDQAPGKAVPPSDPTVPSPRIKLRSSIDEGVGLPSPFGYSPPSYGLMTRIFDTLLIADGSGAIIPWLAAKYDLSPDGVTHNFELRDNVRWHDGKPFTPEDVVFTFDYFKAQAPNLPPFVLYRPDGVASVKVTGPKNVQIRLEKPQANFPRDILATFPIAPKHVWSPIAVAGEASDPKLLVGTGPYRMQEFNEAKGTFRFVANDEFYLGKPFVKELRLKPVGDDLTALVANEIDTADFGVGGATPQALKKFQRDPTYGVNPGELDFSAVLYFDQTQGAPMNDVRFRRACALGINRKQLVERVLGGLGAPGNPGFLPPGHSFHTDVEQYNYNVKEANRLLDEVGLKKGAKGIRNGPDGKPLKLAMAVTPEVAPAVEIVRGDLKKLGIDIQLLPIDPFILFSGQEIKAPLRLFPHGGMSGDPDFMRVVFSSRYERRFFAPKGFSNPEFDDLADKQRETLDLGQRKELINKMQQIVASEVPYLHLYYSRSYFLYRKAVFDQWSAAPNQGPHGGKDTLVTGLKSGGTQIRPIKE